MKIIVATLFVALLAVAVSADFVTITPYTNNGCSGTPYGVGYSLPIGTCFNMYDQLMFIEQDSSNSNKLHFTFYYNNCSSTPIDYQVFVVDQCATFGFPTLSLEFNSSMSLTASMPEDSVQYVQYYYSNYCSGPTLAVFMTNGYQDTDSKYTCVNGKPEVYVCGGDDNCFPVNIEGCHIPGGVLYPWRVIC
ncbi:hypothetical protein DFA_03083 [Cavenderia fasciculata]|uniref:Uncharacterized protein n=1 Tax=Cavenderia fasciculata TaxID=261658 RepID=F4PGK4_CACFS|nr:uncharacterized protein DFA_03083 [Cavenderia fasciculata]EGG24838.1 hypothetical protein DFA_03083 [Cavenderia fasciculata]|eukprot:XP_004362689.1 hypothetical protein DFA_03083 [Cavenderia fasciculata]